MFVEGPLRGRFEGGSFRGSSEALSGLTQGGRREGGTGKECTRRPKGGRVEGSERQREDKTLDEYSVGNTDEEVSERYTGETGQRK